MQAIQDSKFKTRLREYFFHSDAMQPIRDSRFQMRLRDYHAHAIQPIQDSGFQMTLRDYLTRAHAMQAIQVFGREAEISFRTIVQEVLNAIYFAFAFCALPFEFHSRLR